MSIQYYKNANHLTIEAGANSLPIEINVIGMLPKGAGKYFLNTAFLQQAAHDLFVDEYNEPSTLIGKPTFTANVEDPSAVYTFGVDTRDLVFHRHAGKRVILGVTGDKGCLLKFSLATPEEASANPALFFEKLIIVRINDNTVFSLRFNGNIYHQFCPVDYNEPAFFALSVHPDETFGLTGELLMIVKQSQGSIPLLTEPAPESVLQLLDNQAANRLATHISL